MAGDDEKRDGDVSWRQALLTTGLALSIPGLIAGPALVGWFVDSHYGTWPILFLIGLFIGLASTALNIYKLLKRFGQFK